MDAVLICIVAFAASAMTFLSGFGLCTLLLPAFAFFYPIELAVASTAIVHFLNGLFKLALVGRFASWRIVLRFGIQRSRQPSSGPGCSSTSRKSGL